MITKYLLGVAFFLISSVVKPPIGTPTPESIYKFPFTASQQEVYKILDANVKDFTMSDWLEVEKSVRSNNREVEDRVRSINADLQVAYEQMQQLSSSRNIAQIKANLEALKKAKSEMGRIAEERLKPLNYQGLYMAICSKVSSRMPMPNLQKAIQDKFSPDAIKTLNGTFIQSLTELQDNKVEYDYVYEKVSGTMEAIKMEHQDRDFGTNYFVEIWTVRVSPLQKMISSPQSNSISPNNNDLQIKVIDLYNNNNFTHELQSITDTTFRQKLEQHIQENRSRYVQEITAYNSAMRQDESKILQEIEASIQEHERKIITAEKNLNESKLAVEKILRQIGVNFDMGNLEQSLSQAETILSKKIIQLSQQKLDEKSKELIFEKFVGVGTAVDPNQEMAQNATAKIQAINKSHSILSSFIQEIAVKDNKVDLAATATQKDVYREVEYYWVYPIPLGGKFDMGIVAKFRLRDDTQPISLSTPIIQTEPININENWWERYDVIGPFNQGVAIVVGKPVPDMSTRQFVRKCGLVDRNGKEIAPLKYTGISDFDEDGIAIFKKSDGTEVGLIDRTGKEVLAVWNYDSYDFSEGLMEVKKNDKWGFVDKTGKVIIAFEYDWVFPFKEGLAAVSKSGMSGEYGFIDKTGKIVIPFEYGYTDYGNFFSEGLAAVRKNGKYGFIDKTGKVAIPFEYDDILRQGFKEGLIAVNKNGKWGIIDKKGKEITIFEYDDVLGAGFSEGFISVKKNEKWGFVNGTGEVIPCIYDVQKHSYGCCGYHFKEGLAAVIKNGKYGFIDKTGKMVIPFEYDRPFGYGYEIMGFNEGLVSVEKNGKMWVYR